MRELRAVLAALIIGAAISLAKEYVDGPDICRLFQNGMQLRKPGYCTKYVKCQNFQSISGDCTGSTPYWNKDTAKCAAKVSDTYCSAPCKVKSPRYVSDDRNCKGWYECRGSTYVDFGFCAYDMYFDQKKQMCVYPEDTSCSATYNFCDVVPKSKPFKDEENCNKYYQCNTLNKITTKTCPDGEYFNAATAKCIAKALVECLNHPHPENVCGTTKLAYRNRFVSDGATCRGYFYCNDKGVGTPDKAPIWGQCSTNEFFDPQRQACMNRTHLKCDEDRCDGRPMGRELSQKPGCQYYLECLNNSTLSENYCGTGQYFNAESETCTATKIAYPACS